MDTIKWGIVGPGKIAGRFARDLALVDDGTLQAVASRSVDRAQEFAREYSAPKYFDSYEQMLMEGGIDIVYIATPHPFHLEQALLALEHKVPVLCEKPISLNRKEVVKMVQAARANQTFLMEALWTRFIPAIQKALSIVQSGEMGEVEQVEAEFCFIAPQDPNSRLYDLALGGGSLLDIGIYPLFLSYLFLGQPEEIVASGQLAPTGADQTCSMTLSYPDNKSAALHCSIITDSMMPARLTLSKGYILIKPRWHESTGLTIIKAGEEAQEIDLPPIGMGFSHEIRECHDCLRNQKIESSFWSHSDSLNLMTMMDNIREQIGVKYPGRD